MTKYEAWEMDDGCVLFGSENREQVLANPAVKFVKLLYEFEAATGEEASAIHNLRMGFGAYTPNGEPEECPKCCAWFYPQGSGQCWRCGQVC